MTTLQRPRWQVGVAVFVFATPAALWITSGLVGRSLLTLETMGVIAGLGAVAAAFTWAFGSDQEKATARHDANSLEVSAVLKLLPESPADEKTTSRVDPEAGSLEKSPVPAVANSPHTTFASTPELVESLKDDVGQTSRVKRPHGVVAPIQLTCPEPEATSLRVTHASSRALLVTEGARALADGIDRNEVVRREGVPDRSRPVRWFGQGETITAGRYVLRDPMVYVSEGKPQEDEASCIDLSREVGKSVIEPAGSTGYYPTYPKLSPNQRANYLRWISSGRVEPLHDIGYAFLFFYGLERRLLVEREDLSPIVKELVRLLEAYTFSGSFDGYLSRFLAFTLARSGIETLKDKWFEAVFAKSRLQRDEDFLAVALAWFFKKNAPLPVSWAMRIARLDPRSPRSVVLDRFPEQFVSLFEKRYVERFGEGLILQTFLGERLLSYCPASPSIAFNADLLRRCAEPIGLPNILGLQSQFSPLATIWSNCIEELRPSSRAVNRENRVETVPDQSALATPETIQPVVVLAPQTDSRQSQGVKFLVEATGRNLTARHEKTESSARELCWYGKGETLTVSAYQLKDPLVYVSVGQALEDEASCINLSLAVGKPVRDLAGSLGYYLTYSNLSPNQRANYLQWLSSGRAEPLPEIGYAFLFFYGLERRLLLEQQDRGPIEKEVVRLLETYTTSGSLDAYLSRFLAFVLARDGIETIDAKWFEADRATSRLDRDGDFLALALAWFFKKNAPLPVSWAMRIGRQDTRSSSSVVVDRLPEHFKSLFEERYREQFGEGLILEASKSDHSLSYRRISPSSSSRLRGCRSSLDSSGRAIEIIEIPNVLGLQSQFSQLATIWSSCIEELRPLSRVLAKGTEVDSREAFEALPDELKAKVEHPDKGKWDSVVAEHTDENGCALVEVSKLARLHGLNERSKLTPKQSQALAQTAGYVGLVIEPDARLTNRPYSWEDLVSLLRPEERPRLPADSRYLGASLMLELGVYVAAADGTVEDVEIDQVARFLESQFLLDPPDARRLEALKRVFVARPPSLAGLGKRLQTALTREQREAVGRFLTGIAAANGIIDRKEVTALRSAYRALDIGVDQLNSLLEEFRRASQEPVEVQSGDQSSAPGETIPARPQARTDTGFRLDEGLLKRLMAETAEVTEMLAKAMRVENAAEDQGEQPSVLVASLNHLTGSREGEDSSEPDCEEARPEARPLVSAEEPSKERCFKGLDIRFHPMLAQLLITPVWRRADFDSLARELRLMPAGALDAFNTWAYDLFNDPIIIEQGEELHIQSHLVEGPP